MFDKRKFYIGGEWVKPANAENAPPGKCTGTETPWATPEDCRYCRSSRCNAEPLFQHSSASISTGHNETAVAGRRGSTIA